MSHAAELLDYGFNRYILLTQGAICGTVQVKNGSKDYVQVKTAEAVSSVVLKGQEKNLNSEKKLESAVKAPVKQGQKLGEVLVYNNQDLLRKVNLLASQDVPAANPSIISKDSLTAYGFPALLAIIAIILYLAHIRRTQYKIGIIKKKQDGKYHSRR